MYFFKKKGKQYLNLTGNLILSHNDILVKARLKSAGPSGILYPKYIMLGNHRIKATFAVLRFIWGKPNPLLPSDTHLNPPIKKALKVKTGKVIDRSGQDNLYNKFTTDGVEALRIKANRNDE